MNKARNLAQVRKRSKGGHFPRLDWNKILSSAAIFAASLLGAISLYSFGFTMPMGFSMIQLVDAKFISGAVYPFIAFSLVNLALLKLSISATSAFKSVSRPISPEDHPPRREIGGRYRSVFISVAAIILAFLSFGLLLSPKLTAAFISSASLLAIAILATLLILHRLSERSHFQVSRLSNSLSKLPKHKKLAIIASILVPYFSICTLSLGNARFVTLAQMPDACIRTDIEIIQGKIIGETSSGIIIALENAPMFGGFKSRYSGLVEMRFTPMNSIISIDSNCSSTS